ncbi:MAG TPA: hypothetical protein VMH28_30110 [Candidatus Acidoferrales bacterium]|nr:hypothetical protein [Candidatus Acidoferrales bacterium]
MLKMRILWLAVAIGVVLWGVSLTRSPRNPVWIHPVQQSGTGPARILRFYASTGAAAPGQRVQLCYAVENARSVRISPMFRTQYPASNYCLAVTPEHTTHFTLLAEGYDGSVAARSFTLPVQTVPVLAPERAVSIAGL